MDRNRSQTLNCASTCTAFRSPLLFSLFFLFFSEADAGLLVLSETFFDIVQPIIPFFSKRWLLDRIDQGLHVRVDSFFAMLLSISSLALIQPVLLWKAPGMFSNPIETGYILYREASRLHDLARTSDSLDHFSLFTSYFLFAVCTGMGKKTEAWLRLREALSIAEVLELDSLASDQIDEGDSQAFDLRVSLVLCITERCVLENLLSQNVETLTCSMISQLPCPQPQEVSRPSQATHHAPSGRFS